MTRKTNAGGFTLIELLIVTVVIVTLMGIVFRLAGTGTDAKARGVTVSRLQRLENALSGYYAAFGCYPPVPLHGYRSIYLEVNSRNIQIPSREKKFSLTADTSASDYYTIQRQIMAACRSQPLAARYPYNKNVENYLSELTKQLAKRANSSESRYKAYKERSSLFNQGFDGLETNPGRFNGHIKEDHYSWADAQVFQFGLMSYLLPRYLFMLQGLEEYYDDEKIGLQWRASNSLPARMDTGVQFGSWAAIQKALGVGDQYGTGNSTGGTVDAALVSNILSQAVCARWMQNFEHIVRGGKTFYGVDTCDPDEPGFNYVSPDIGVFAVGNADDSSGSQPYVLDGMTVEDGWGNEFFYYSPPPYQTYQLWSAGPDGCTFPPWIDLATLNSSDRKVAARWLSDDIVHLSN